MEMPQIGNWAIICAERPDVVMQIIDGKTIVFVGKGFAQRQFTLDCSDNNDIDAGVQA